MAEDKPKDQPAVSEQPKSEEAFKMPERGFFEGDNMQRFAEQLEMTAKESSGKTSESDKKRPCPEGVPCPEADEKKAKPEHEGKPYKILKVKGREIPVSSEDEYNELAQKGLHYTQERQKDSVWEKDLQEREDRLSRIEPHMARVVEFLDGGGKFPGSNESKMEDIPPEEEILDPVAADKMKRLEVRLQSLETENKSLKGNAQVENFKRAQTELDQTFNSVTKEVPFEQVLDEDGRNISQELFSGLVALKVNKDAMRLKTERGFKMKTMAEYFKDGASDLAHLEKHFRGNGPGEISADIVKTKFPRVAEDLGTEAIDAYLKKQEEKGEPIIRSTKTEPSVRPPKREFTGIRDAIEQAVNDPEIWQGLDELGKKFSLGK